MSPEDRQLIKHAQRELIGLCGGADKVTELVNVGRTTVYRWADTGEPSLMPGHIFIPLQRKCGTPVVTQAYASLENRDLSDARDRTDAGQCVHTAMAATMVAIGSLNARYGAAMSDLKLTPNEISGLVEGIGVVIQRMTEERRTLSALQARGGVTLLGRTG